MFLNYSSAFSFLYWSALRCRNEGAEITLPAAARDDSRKSGAGGVRPATLIWAGMPVLMLAVIVVRASVSPAAQDMDDVSTDGRRTALLKLIDGGRGVDTLLSGHETALFDAVRHGDEKLVAELLAGAPRSTHRTVQGTLRCCWRCRLGGTNWRACCWIAAPW